MSGLTKPPRLRLTVDRRHTRLIRRGQPPHTPPRLVPPLRHHNAAVALIFRRGALGVGLGELLLFNGRVERCVPFLPPHLVLLRRRALGV